MRNFCICMILITAAATFQVMMAGEKDNAVREHLLADSLYHAGLFPEAKTHYFTALELKKEAGDTLGAALCRLGIAKISYFEGYYSKAQKLIEEILPVFEKNRLYKKIFQCRQTLGDIHAKRGQYDDAVAEYRRAVDQGEKADDAHLTCQGLQSMGHLSVVRGRYYGAKISYSLALSAAPGGIDSGYVYIGLGDAYAMNDEFENSLTYLDSALTMAEISGDSALFGDIYGAKAHTYRRSGDYLKALDFYSKQLEIIKSRNDQLGRAETMMNMAGIFEIQKQYARAGDFMEEVVLIFSELNSPETEKAKEFLRRLRDR